MMNNKRIYLSSPHMSGGEQKYLTEAFRENWIAPLGPNVDGLEQELARYCGVKHCAALSSGTAAIHLSLIMLGVGPGDLVLCQSFTFGASAFPIVQLGATPVFIDSEKSSWNMDPELLEKAISECIQGKGSSAFAEASADGEGLSMAPKLPKAIIPVHLYGMHYNVEGIHRVAEKYNIPVIEDAAEALGSRVGDKMAGSFGKLGVLSFNGNKIITTSGGGALLSDDEALIKKARFLSTQARDPAPHYEHSQVGYNYRMSNILAGIGRGQLEVIEQRVKQRRAIFEWYKEKLKEFDGISFQEDPSESYYSNRWLTAILIDPSKTGFNREDLRVAMEKENIEARPLWKPMHLQPVFDNAPAFSNGTSEHLFKYGLCLPSGSNMNENDLRRVLDVIEELF